MISISKNNKKKKIILRILHCNMIVEFLKYLCLYHHIHQVKYTEKRLYIKCVCQLYKSCLSFSHSMKYEIISDFIWQRVYDVFYEPIKISERTDAVQIKYICMKHNNNNKIFNRCLFWKLPECKYKHVV